MFSCYVLTEMEKKIERMYKDKNILSPTDLDIQNVANLFNVKVDFSEGPQRAVWDEEFSVIFLNPNHPVEKQKEVFFHELGHPILHCGDQTKIRNSHFRELQEAQANQFQLYAAIPFFMLKDLELPPYEYEIINTIKTVFKVPESLATKRLEQIKRRIYQSKMDNFIFEERIAESEHNYLIKESFPLLEDLFSEEEINSYLKPKMKKKPKLYYDFIDGKPYPIWYCLDVNRGEVNWRKELHLHPIDADFEIYQINDFVNQESDAPVSSEIVLHHSHPNDFAIDLNPLKKKLLFYDLDPYNIRRFVIDASILEHVLQLDIFTTKLNQRVQLPCQKLT